MIKNIEEQVKENINSEKIVSKFLLHQWKFKTPIF